MFVRNVNTGNYQLKLDDGRWLVVDMAVAHEVAIATIHAQGGTTQVSWNEFLKLVPPMLDREYWLTRIGNGAYFL